MDRVLCVWAMNRDTPDDENYKTHFSKRLSRTEEVRYTEV